MRKINKKNKNLIKYYYDNYNNIQIKEKDRLLLELDIGVIDTVCFLQNISWKRFCEMNNTTLKEDYIKICKE